MQHHLVEAGSHQMGRKQAVCLCCLSLLPDCGCYVTSCLHPSPVSWNKLLKLLSLAILSEDREKVHTGLTPGWHSSENQAVKQCRQSSSKVCGAGRQHSYGLWIQSGLKATSEASRNRSQRAPWLCPRKLESSCFSFQMLKVLNKIDVTVKKKTKKMGPNLAMNVWESFIWNI